MKESQDKYLKQLWKLLPKDQLQKVLDSGWGEIDGTFIGFINFYYYIQNQIDYAELADWCKTRKGQVIVCENTKADWLNFEPLVKITGQKIKTTEAIWTNYKVNSLFD